MDEKLPVFVALETDVLLDKRLTSTEKILYSIICSLANNTTKCCYASNKYICKLINLNKRQLVYCLNKLKELNYIVVEIQNGNKRKITPTINRFLEFRNLKVQNIQLIDYDWLKEEN